jgi:hypothetical protein
VAIDSSLRYVLPDRSQLHFFVCAFKLFAKGMPSPQRQIDSDNPSDNGAFMIRFERIGQSRA